MFDLFQFLIDQGVFVALFITFFVYVMQQNRKREQQYFNIIEKYIMKTEGFKDGKKE